MKQYAIYNNPKDYPGKVVVRLWIIRIDNSGYTIQAGLLISVSDTLEQARMSLPDGLNLIPRFDEDDSAIAEVWI